MKNILKISAFIAMLFSSQLSHAGLFGKDPESKRSYSVDEIKLLQSTKQAQLRQTDGFVIEDGYVFYIKSNVSPKYISGSSDVKQVVLFKGKLIALDKDGDVYILTEDKKLGEGEWYKIGNSTIDVESDDTDLFALTYRKTWFTRKEVRGVWNYKGQPGDLVWTYIPLMMPYSCGANQTCYNTIFIPTIAGREIAFTDMNVVGAIKFQKANGKLYSITQDGKSILLSRQAGN